MRRLRSATLPAVVALLLAVAWPVAQPATAVAQPVAQPAAQPTTTTTPFQTPDTSACPHRTTPPPPVDLSEMPAPGRSAPDPLPVRKDPIGGPRMSQCGLVLPDPSPPLPAGLSANAWLVADLDSGEVLAARDPHGRHRAASTIKVLTALVALAELDPATPVIGTDEDANQEGSRVGIGATGSYTVDQLLYGLLMRSGNDAAHALAVQLGGVAATVDKMNALAAELGALDTRAATPSGLDGPGSSTSAYDLGLIFRVAMRNPRFATMVATTQIDFPGFKDKPGFIVANDNRLLANYPGALGGKTGFTDDARHTYIGAAQRGGRRLLVVLLRGEQQPVRMWEQAAALLDYGFTLPAGVTPVGTLVDAAPTSSTTPSATGAAAGSGTAAGPGTVSAAPAAEPAADRTLLYVAGLLAVAVALVAALWWRRTAVRRTPAARQPVAPWDFWDPQDPRNPQ